MSKILQGKVVSTKMNSTAIIEVSRRVPHRLYKKITKISKKFKVDTNGKELEVGQVVKIIETRPISKDKHFAIFMDDIKSKKSTSKKSREKKEEKE